MVFDRIIQKYLKYSTRQRSKVVKYTRNVSQGNHILNKKLKEMSKIWLPALCQNLKRFLFSLNVSNELKEYYPKKRKR